MGPKRKPADAAKGDLEQGNGSDLPAAARPASQQTPFSSQGQGTNSTVGANDGLHGNDPTGSAHGPVTSPFFSPEPELAVRLEGALAGMAPVAPLGSTIHPSASEGHPTTQLHGRVHGAGPPNKPGAGWAGSKPPGGLKHGTLFRSFKGAGGADPAGAALPTVHSVTATSGGGGGFGGFGGGGGSGAPRFRSRLGSENILELAPGTSGGGGERKGVVSLSSRGALPHFVDFRVQPRLATQLSQHSDTSSPKHDRTAAPSRQRSLLHRKYSSFAPRTSLSRPAESTPFSTPFAGTGSLEAPLLSRMGSRLKSSAPAAAEVAEAGEDIDGAHKEEEEEEGLDAVGKARHQRPIETQEGPPEAGWGTAMVIGAINTGVAIPAQIAFATIVFQDPLYVPYLGNLCKFLFFASAIHQLTFMALSSLPAAVGQVQDIGLIFLSAIASSVALIATSADRSPAMALGTALVALCIATFCVGALTLIFGKLRLARLTQYVPNPVVMGYLAYVGYFLFAGGVGLTTGIQLDSVAYWVDVFNWQYAGKVAALVSTAVLLRLACTNMRVLSSVLLAVPLAFHAVLLATGRTLEQAQDDDWVMKPMEGSQQFWQLWGFFNLDFADGLSGVLASVYWPAIMHQLPKIIGLFIVVCFGSCLDVTAIQQASPTPLNFDQELITVGASNMLASLVGAGYTGSYIISQTKFTLKTGVRSRVSSAVIALVELTVFALPFSVVQYVPKFFFGALLLWFGVEMMAEQLYDSFHKLSLTEYALLLLTFLAIMWQGLMAGIIIGIALVTFVFAYEYAKSSSSALNQVCAFAGTSSTVYSYSHMALLDLLLPRRVVGVTLSGFLFFGNSVSICDSIEEIAAHLVATADEGAALDPADNFSHAASLDDPPPAGAPGTDPAPPGQAQASGSGGSERRAGEAGGTGMAGDSGRADGAMAGAGVPRQSVDSIGYAPPVLSDASFTMTSGTFRTASGASGQFPDTFRAPSYGRSQPSVLLQRLRSNMGWTSGALASPSPSPSPSPTPAPGVAAGQAAFAARALTRDQTFSKRGRRLRRQQTAKMLWHMRDGPLFLIVDLRHVPRLDSTAAGRLASLNMLLYSRHVEVLVTGLAGRRDRRVSDLLEANGMRLVRRTPPPEGEDGQGDGETQERWLGPGEVWEFPSMEIASRYCEERLLAYAADCKLVEPAQATVTLDSFLSMHFGGAPSAGDQTVMAHASAWGTDLLFPSLDIPAMVNVLQQYFVPENITRGHILFEQGDVLDSLYLIQTGKLHLYAASREQVVLLDAARHATCDGRHGMAHTHAAGATPAACVGYGPLLIDDAAAGVIASTLECGPGCFVCPQDFCMNQATAFTARCYTRSATVLRLRLEAYGALKREQPDAFIALQVALTRSLSLDLSTAMSLTLPDW